MATEKEVIFSTFHSLVDTHVGFWRGRRVIPYSRAYADAYAAYVDTRKEAEKDQGRRMELYLAVGMLVGAAACGLGPVAGAIAAGHRSARIGVVALANAANRLGLSSRASAWMLMSKFTFGSAPKVASAAWGSHGKDILKKHMTQFTGGVVMPGAAAAAVQSPLRSGIKRDKMPIEFFLELEGLLLKAENAIMGCALEMVSSPGVSAKELQQYCDAVGKSNLFTKSPRVDMPLERMMQLANEMEMAMWAFAASSWRSTRTVPAVNRTGMGPSTRVVTDYSDYLGEDRILERIDKLAKNLKMSHYITERSVTGSPLKQLNGKASWDDHFGFWHSDDDKDLLIKWAKTYVTAKANKAMMPLELL